MPRRMADRSAIETEFLFPFFPFSILGKEGKHLSDGPSVTLDFLYAQAS
jgi:hypothetical protein